jgi:hypothetical protein
VEVESNHDAVGAVCNHDVAGKLPLGRAMPPRDSPSRGGLHCVYPVALCAVCAILHGVVRQTQKGQDQARLSAAIQIKSLARRDQVQAGTVILVLYSGANKAGAPART